MVQDFISSLNPKSCNETANIFVISTACCRGSVLLGGDFFREMTGRWISRQGVNSLTLSNCPWAVVPVFELQDQIKESHCVLRHHRRCTQAWADIGKHGCHKISFKLWHIHGLMNCFYSEAFIACTVIHQVVFMQVCLSCEANYCQFLFCSHGLQQTPFHF